MEYEHSAGARKMLNEWLNYQAAQERISKQNFKEFRSEDLSAILAKANTYLLEHE